MGRKLYVGNLPFETGDDELKLAFAQCGTVSEAKVIVDRETGRNRGFGFVTMSSDQEAQIAMSRWDGATLGGRPLKVNEATDRPRDQRAGSQSTSQQGGYSRGTYVADAPPPPPDRGRGNDRGRGRGGRGRDRGDNYG